MFFGPLNLMGGALVLGVLDQSDNAGRDLPLGSAFDVDDPESPAKTDPNWQGVLGGCRE